MFTVCLLTREQSSDHSSVPPLHFLSDLSSRSVGYHWRILCICLQADYTIWSLAPYFFLCFKVMSSCIDTGESSKLLFCLELINYVAGDIWKKCFVGILYVVLTSKSDTLAIPLEDQSLNPGSALPG